MSQGMGSKGPVARRKTAEKLKERFEWLQSFSDDELRDINYCTTGEPMRDDELYFDISHPERGIIQGQSGERIPEGSCYVPKSEISQGLWDKLVAPYA
ncbi:MAG: hypothetical protein ACM3US_11085 [Sphingomonadaceae bacterium]